MILILLDPDPYHPLFDPDSISSPSSRILILLFIVHSVNFCTGCGRCPSFPQLSAQACGHSSPHPSSTHSGMWQGHPLPPYLPCAWGAPSPPYAHGGMWQVCPLPPLPSPPSAHSGMWQGCPLPPVCPQWHVAETPLPPVCPQWHVAWAPPPPHPPTMACGRGRPSPLSAHSGMWQGHPLQPIHPNKCVAEALCHSAWQGRPLPCRYAQACGKSSSSPSSIHTGIWQGRPLPHIPFHIPFHNFFHIFL